MVVSHDRLTENSDAVLVDRVERTLLDDWDVLLCGNHLERMLAMIRYGRYE